MIAGVATETIVVSTRIMKKPRQSAKSAGHGLSLVSTGGWVRASVTGALNHGPPTPIPRALL